MTGAEQLIVIANLVVLTTVIIYLVVVKRQLKKSIKQVYLIQASMLALQAFLEGNQEVIKLQIDRQGFNIMESGLKSFRDKLRADNEAYKKNITDQKETDGDACIA